MIKADGTLAIHSDGNASKPLNWMVAPNVVEISEDRWEVTNGKGEKLVIAISEMLEDVTHSLGDDPGLQKDGVEAHLQELLAVRPWVLEEGLGLIRREYPTDIGPVDLLCADQDGRVVAVEVERRGEIDGVEQRTATWTDWARTAAGAGAGMFVAQVILLRRGVGRGEGGSRRSKSTMTVSATSRTPSFVSSICA